MTVPGIDTNAPRRIPAKRADGSPCVVLATLVRDGTPPVIDYELLSPPLMLTRLGPRHFQAMNTREVVVADEAT